MIKHVVLWNIKEELSATDKERAKEAIKHELEGLQEKIPEILSIQVYTETLPSASADLMLESTFDDDAALERYLEHPAHKEAANRFVRPVVSSRASIDYVDD